MRRSTWTRSAAAALAGVALVAIGTAAEPQALNATVRAGPCTRSEGFAVCLVDPTQSATAGARPPAGDEVTMDEQHRPLWLRSHVAVAADGVASAVAGVDAETGQPVVLVTFNDKGRRQFAALTTANVSSRVALLLDGVVVSTPVIQEPILGGHAQITGDFTKESAREAADRINAARASPKP